MAIALADRLTLHKPIRLERQGPGASSSVIYSGCASGDHLLHGYGGNLTAEMTKQARMDTAAGLVGVPIVSPEDHQRWTDAFNRGEDYTETPLGTVIAAEYDEASDTVPLRFSVHDADAIRRIDSGEWPMGSVAYKPKLGEATRADADFAQIGRTVRHYALVPKGRDSKAITLRDAFADGAEPMTLADLKRKHPDLYKRARSALIISGRAGVAVADAISIDKAIPLIQEMMKDEIGKLVLHAIVNAPEEIAEIEAGSEDAGSVDPAMNNQGMADALTRATTKIADLEQRIAGVVTKVEPLIARTAAADRALADAALSTRAADLAKALDRATIARPEGFDPSKPTVAMCDAATDLLVRELAGPRARYTFTAGAQGDTWDPKTRARIPATGATADAAPITSIDEL